MDLDIEYMANQVKEIYPEKEIQDVVIDLQFTKNIQTTLTRIENGQFLKSTIRDPSKTFIILDSDEEGDSIDACTSGQRTEKEKDNKLINPTEK
ncbi:hypothetical protein BJ944DRAFT_45270 [Cunninghamella echinulata]|nr:hypothetical protein BJ944DRAFT_45270 [Cunninghamella echinulata]